jgi:hypothetical protein
MVGMISGRNKADILHQKRLSVRLPPPINRFYLHALSGEDRGSKVKKKSSFVQVPSSCSSLCFSLHRGLLPQPPEPPPAATVLPVFNNSTCTVRNGRRSKNRDRQRGEINGKKKRNRKRVKKQKGGERQEKKKKKNHSCHRASSPPPQHTT